MKKKTCKDNQLKIEKIKEIIGAKNFILYGLTDNGELLEIGNGDPFVMLGVCEVGFDRLKDRVLKNFN